MVFFHGSGLQLSIRRRFACLRFQRLVGVFVEALSSRGKDRFIGVGGEGVFSTDVPMLCTGSVLRITADVDGGSRSSIRVAKAVPLTGLELANSGVSSKRARSFFCGVLEMCSCAAV